MSEVLGVPQLLGRFARMAVASEVAADTATSMIAERVAATARAKAPVATGRLRDSITADKDRVYTDVEYAPFVEYGTATDPAQPFLRPAADEVGEATDALNAAAAILMRV